MLKKKKKDKKRKGLTIQELKDTLLMHKKLEPNMTPILQRVPEQQNQNVKYQSDALVRYSKRRKIGLF